MSASELFHRYLDECPLVAIIRGVTPAEAEAIGDALYEGGIRIIEVPLNSPDPLASIEQLAAKFGDRVLVGAGTVLKPDDVAKVGSAGGRIIVSPDTNPEVIGAAASAGLVSSPGFFTPSEGFTAIRAGATALKLFPAEGASPAVLKAGSSPTTCALGSTPAHPASASVAGSISPASRPRRRSPRPAPMWRG